MVGPCCSCLTLDTIDSIQQRLPPSPAALVEDTARNTSPLTERLLSRHARYLDTEAGQGPKNSQQPVLQYRSWRWWRLLNPARMETRGGSVRLSE